MPGRLRLRIPTRRGDVSFFQHVVQALSGHPAVRELAANPLTGGILICHSGSAQAIAGRAAEQGLFEIATEQPRKKTRAAANPATNTAGAAAPLDAAATGLSGLALLQVAKGEITGSAAENLWNAYGAHRILGRPGIAAGFVALGLYQMLSGQLFASASSLFFYSLLARQLASLDRAASAMSGMGRTGKPPAAKPADRQRARGPG